MIAATNKTILTTLLLCSAAPTFSDAIIDTPVQPNILLLVAEDMSDKVGAFGDPVAHTPNLDRLAAKGVRYDHVFTTSGVCAPSRAALITGVHQNSLGAQHMRTQTAGFHYTAIPEPEVKAFPELLRRHGYYTFTDFKLDYQFSGTMAGSGPFTIWNDEGVNSHWRNRKPNQPFFGMINFMETHESGLFPRWTWPQSVTHLVMQAMHINYHWGMEDRISPKQVNVPPYYPDTAIVRQTIARQYNNIVTMDQRVGEILAQLKADGLDQSTIVIWTTDHGDGLPRAKREVFDSGIKVPMIIYWPETLRPENLSPNTLEQQLISMVDLAPTILSLANITAPRFIQGQSFLGPKKREYIYAAKDRMDGYPDRQRAIRDQRYKYIVNYQSEQAGAQAIQFREHLTMMEEFWTLYDAGQLNDVQQQWFKPRPQHALYDTQLDPYEINNVAEQPAYQPIRKRLSAQLQQWQQQSKDWGEMDEITMAEQFWPSAEQPITAAPLLKLMLTIKLLLLLHQHRAPLLPIAWTVHKIGCCIPKLSP
ncbi:sulfatase [Oceanicoccus sp. KOV_DT_Chl]|uniref:sulfatase family protein n=1 Tax=Oceanicoccus sp. KOV_DT_Chl TaxID=1904639 RepID=UPI000C7A241F|nr:sulfatase [Oceanicoccus sp. KOV_DT_Chl]